MSCLNCGHQIREDARFCERCGAPQAGPRDGQLGLATAPFLAGNPYVRALRRFWWLIVVGVGVAALAALASVYRIDFFSVPPSVEKRDQVTYTASARLLVTSDEAPFFRTTITRTIEGGDSETPQEYLGAPDLGVLINTANLYPVLIESDEVERIRRDMEGPLEGTITSRAIYEVNSPSRFEPSQVPVVEIFGSADSYSSAVEITQATVDAFRRYVDRIQDDAGLVQRERILIEQIQRPAFAVASGGTSLSLPLMLFVVIAAAFVVLAILLNRLFPFGLRLPGRGRAAAPVPAFELPEPDAEVGEETRRTKAPV